MIHQRPGAPSGLSLCERLPLYEDALMALLSGQQTHTLKMGDQLLVFNNSNLKELRSEVQMMRNLCHGPRRGAVRAGPYSRRPVSGFGRYGGYGSPFGWGF